MLRFTPIFSMALRDGEENEHWAHIPSQEELDMDLDFLGVQKSEPAHSPFLHLVVNYPLSP